MEKHKKGYHIIGEIYNRANISPKKTIFAIFASVLYNIKNITMKKNHFTQICELFDQFSKDANLQMEKGNKAAGTRARKVSLELEKTSQTVQKRVTRSIEIIFILVLTVGKMANFTCTISKKPLRFTAERLH